MKKNTRKLLFLLSSPDYDSTKLPLSVVKELFSHLSDGGFRSWIFHLRKQGEVFVEQANQGPLIYLTAKGERSVSKLFPALNSQWDTWEGEWMLLLCLRAPKGDKQFRYLRQLLISEGSLPLSRGSYLFPQACSEKVRHECQLRYADSVALCTVNQWVLGLESPVIITYYDLDTLARLYSSISESIDRLLMQNDTKNRLIRKHKIQLFSEIDRLFECVQDDPGFLAYYFPDVQGVRGILPKIHQLLLL
ncbi:MAG: hypothetical protein WDZ94_04315 [Patescibacteria group bacterium]